MTDPTTEPCPGRMVCLQQDGRPIAVRVDDLRCITAGFDDEVLGHIPDGCTLVFPDHRIAVDDNLEDVSRAVEKILSQA